MNDARVRHAVSIDEKRRPFREYLVTPTDDSRLEEVWFAGVHTDVGGTFPDDARLSTVSLKWIVEGAVEEGMLVDPPAYAKSCTVSADNVNGIIHKNPWIYKIFIDRTRPIPADAVLHSSVRARIEGGGVRAAPDADLQWADPTWETPTGRPPSLAPASPTAP